MLYKWHSNEQALETNDSVNENELNLPNNNLEQNQRKQKYYGYYGTKSEDSFIIQVPNVNKNASKRNILSTLASIYDPLGFVSPCLFLGNNL